MPIRERFNGFQVEVNSKKALEGFKRVRVQVNGDRAAALLVEQEIKENLRVYGKHPVGPQDLPLDAPEPKKPERVGTLRLATGLALTTHWAGTPYAKTVNWVVWSLVRFFEEVRGVYDIDDIRSADIDALVTDCKSRGNTANTINKRLSMLSVVNTVALERTPPLASIRLPLKRQKSRPVEKWWLRPEDLERLLDWYRGSKNDPIFADFIEVIVREGLRPSEALGLEARHLSDLETDTPWLKVPGTKTAGSEAAIPVYPDAVELMRRCAKRSHVERTGKLFPYTWRQASDRWNEARAYLGVSDVTSATLRALRRTFAYYANQRSMPTRTIQKVLRHETITTTEGYLRLTGTNELEQSRDYFATATPKVEEQVDPIMRVIAAYKATGAAPEEVAKFTKEMLR